MKSWYSTREGANLQHKSQPIANGKRIFLTEAQAKLHGDKIDSSEPPSIVEESGVKSEYEEWIKTNQRSATTEPEPEAKQGKTNTKPKQ